MRVVFTHKIERIVVECANFDQHRVSLHINLSTYGGALADPEYVRMVAPQLEPRKKVANLQLRSSSSIGANYRVVTNSWTLL